MKILSLLLLAAFLLGCEEPAIVSRVGDLNGEEERAVVVLKDGEEIECVYAKQIEVGGWECWNYSPKQKRNEYTYPDSKRWFDDGAVKEVRPVYDEGQP